MTDQPTNDPVEPRCEQCGQYLTLCGHDLPFKERIKRVAILRRWAGTKTDR